MILPTKVINSVHEPQMKRKPAFTPEDEGSPRTSSSRWTHPPRRFRWRGGGHSLERRALGWWTLQALTSLICIFFQFGPQARHGGCNRQKIAENWKWVVISDYFVSGGGTPKISEFEISPDISIQKMKTSLESRESRDSLFEVFSNGFTVKNCHTHSLFCCIARRKNRRKTGTR